MKFEPFLHNVMYDVWQVCYVNENNYLCARTYKGRHAEEFAREFLEELSREQKNERNGNRKI